MNYFWTYKGRKTNKKRNIFDHRGPRNAENSLKIDYMLTNFICYIWLEFYSNCMNIYQMIMINNDLLKNAKFLDYVSARSDFYLFCDTHMHISVCTRRIA